MNVQLLCIVQYLLVDFICFSSDRYFFQAESLMLFQLNVDMGNGF
jgi:hypothetical protein